MITAFAWILLWLGFIAYALFLAPPAQPDTWDLIQHLSIGQWEEINPLVIALFNLMGIWPMVYGCLLLVDGRDQKIPAWPFVVLSFGIGAFALIPYLALREPTGRFTGQKDALLKLTESRALGIGLTVVTIALMGQGLSQENWTDFVQQWQASQFIHVMSLDFCVLSLLFPVVLWSDMVRRNWRNPWVIGLLGAIPLLGATLYLCLRPALPEESSDSPADLGNPVESKG